MKTWTDFQEKHYSKTAEREHNKDREIKAVELLKKHVPEAKKVYDFGCGSGHLVVDLLLKGYDIYGFDLHSIITACRDRWAIQTDKTSIRLMKQHFLPHDFNVLSWTHGEADAIIVNEMIEHVIYDIEFLTMCAGIAPLLILSTPSKCTMTEGDHHLRYYPKPSLEKLLKIAGFKVIDTTEAQGSLFVVAMRK